MSPVVKNVMVWFGIAVLVVSLYSAFNPTVGGSSSVIPYSDFIRDAKSSKIRTVSLQGDYIFGEYTDGQKFNSLKPAGEQIADTLVKNNIRVEVKPLESGVGGIFGLLLSWFPMLLLIGVWIFFMRQMQGKGGGGALSFGKSRAKLLTEKTGRVTFEDVAGIEEAKEELQEIVEFLKDPNKFQRLGGKIPKGALLIGPPGTGKTLIARAVAGEANVPFFTISGSDFVEMFVGVGASRVRDMFEQGKKSAPCIIFIDEIDAVGRHRGAGMGGGNDEREQTLNQLLVEMDGFESSEGVILIAATNRPDVLDPALLRPGRFDRQVIVPNPDINGREKILKVHMKKVPLYTDVNVKVLARGTPGFSGADLANLVNEAALLAARQGKRSVDMICFEQAKDKVMMGAERKTLAMTEEEKRLTAYHEAGHAVVAIHEIASDPIHKATIIPRGRALGLVMRLPEGDRVSLAIDKIKADLAVAMGGRVAEDLVFGTEKITTGASGDIQMATSLAHHMVTEWGMSEKLGMIRYSAPDNQEGYSSSAAARIKNLSDKTAEMVDSEIRRIIDTAYNRATELLTKHRSQLDAVANALLEYETLSGDDIKTIMEGGKIDRPEPAPEQRVIKTKTGTSMPVGGQTVEA
jgi:cell division protease FtsH